MSTQMEKCNRLETHAPVDVMLEIEWFYVGSSFNSGTDFFVSE